MKTNLKHLKASCMALALLLFGIVATIDMTAHATPTSKQNDISYTLVEFQDVSKPKCVSHDYISTVFEPTCTENGYIEFSCSNCNYSYRQDTNIAHGHDYGIVSSLEATTGWGGFNIYLCDICGHSYEETFDILNEEEWPKGYMDETGTITIYKEWYENAYVYAAHLEFTDYSRLSTDSAFGKYNSGRERTSAAAERIGAIFIVNGDYAVPANYAGNYAVARNGVVCNDRRVRSEGVYDNKTGLLLYPADIGVYDRQLSEVIAEGTFTDTFQFGPAFLRNGEITGVRPSSTGRAQRTFIGTNGKAGDIWICVSDGRWNDKASDGLTGYQCAAYLQSKGCIFGLPLDGGGSSTMWFNGEVLNANNGDNERFVVDYLYFK